MKDNTNHFGGQRLESTDTTFLDILQLISILSSPLLPSPTVSLSYA